MARGGIDRFGMFAMCVTLVRPIERVATKPELRYFIIDAIAINEIDATGQDMLNGIA